MQRIARGSGEGRSRSPLVCIVLSATTAVNSFLAHLTLRDVSSCELFDGASLDVREWLLIEVNTPRAGESVPDGAGHFLKRQRTPKNRTEIRRLRCQRSPDTRARPIVGKSEKFCKADVPVVHEERAVLQYGTPNSALGASHELASADNDLESP